jgi:hypothetical protein
MSKKGRADKRISLSPLSFEEALGGILKAGPHPIEEKPKVNTELSTRKKGRPRKKDQALKDSQQHR